MAAQRRLKERGLLYTAQDVARFCEVDLKTIHHWADAGKIVHYRTEGRHLRFRHIDLVRFLRTHGYPLAGLLTSARPMVFQAMDSEELTKKLAPRFEVRRFDYAAIALAHLVSGAPDAVVVSATDPTLGPQTLAALKTVASTAWPLVVVVGDGSGDLVVRPAEIGRVPGELAALLGLEN